MKRWTILLAGAALWLFLAAIPALADGGPHVAATNSGVSGGLTADSCAGCHRAHTAQGQMLLVEDESTLCLTCHGAGATGATTNVVNGVQFVPDSVDPELRTGAILGALRNGGFVTAAIGSGSAYRLAYASGANIRQLPKVPVRVDANGVIAGQAVTSSHLDLDGANGVVSSGMAWGNILGTPGVTFSPTSDPGGSGTLTCGSCHNPHGNGQYRILQEIPNLIAPNGFDAAATGVLVTDAAPPPATTTRNYTVIQEPGGTLTAAAAAAYPNTAGDYLHRRVPWNASTGSVLDAPNGVATTFNDQITAWCSQCHSRYLATTAEPYATDSTDAIFKYRHPTTRNQACTTCHVSHGSNAQMTEVYSATMEYPGGAVAPVGDSRLLKIDNRGTCQACHDPTGTIVAGQSVGPLPVPLLP